MLKRKFIVFGAVFMGLMLIGFAAHANPYSCLWEIDKTARAGDQLINELTLAKGQSFLVNYFVFVNMTGSTERGLGDSCDVEARDTNAVSDGNPTGFLGYVGWGDVKTFPPKTFTYPKVIGPYAECGIYEVPNIASLVDQDPANPWKIEDSWTIKVDVPCEGGCTLTPGYWKTHSKYGPAPYDDTWALVLPNGEDTPFFNSGKNWYQVLWTPPAGGNAYYILAHAYIAAKLNEMNGASSTAEVDAAKVWAEVFFGTYTPKSKLNKAKRNEAIAYANILDQYNNGYTGPGHCSE